MASAQVLRKQEHLEAGRRKLEEFRKKKAAERAKKNASDGPVHTSDAGAPEKQISNSERVQPIDSDVTGISDAAGTATPEPSPLEENKVIVEPEMYPISRSNFPSDASVDLATSGLPLHPKFSSKEIRGNDASQFEKRLNAEFDPPHEKEIDGAFGNTSAAVGVDQSAFPHLSSQNIDNTSWQSRNHGFYGNLLSDPEGQHKDLSVTKFGSSHSFLANGFPDGTENVFHHENSGHVDRMVGNYTSSSHEALHSTRGGTNYISEVGEKMGGSENNISVVSDVGESRLSGSVQMGGVNNLSPWSLGSNYSGFGSSNYGQLSLSSSGTSGRRSRPSFLDSINISRGPSASPPVSGPVNVDLFGSKVHPEDTLGSHASQNLTNSSVDSGNGVDIFKLVTDKNLESKQDFYPRKQDEDFTALEQHIEDLTQEKFSLQRALDASRALAESLAAENTTLTDNYNQQGSVVNQLRSDMEKLQEEIRAYLMDLEAVKAEYTNAQLECNAADERAKLLASEVIGLEEKALRLRSNELKLERQLEESQTEISSFKKKFSSLEKDRQDLQATIDALQEEKKLLHSKLRKASANGKLVEVSKIPISKKDVSTSTEDLGENNNVGTNVGTSDMHGDVSSSLPLLHDNREFSPQDRSLVIPPDQLRMIENINTLISELTLEKEELVQALSAESSQSSKLKELNKELSRKLEVQTQRLELLTAQSMVNDGVQARQPDSRTVIENTQYADEGDEVVERVLGWIMKLFPGGPSRRRTSKLL